MNTWIRWNKTRTAGLVQNLDEHGPPWLGTVRYEEPIGDCYTRRRHRCTSARKTSACSTLQMSAFT
jgi:hypothetical protein